MEISTRSAGYTVYPLGWECSNQLHDAQVLSSRCPRAWLQQGRARRLHEGVVMDPKYHPTGLGNILIPQAIMARKTRNLRIGDFVCCDYLRDKYFGFVWTLHNNNVIVVGPPTMPSGITASTLNSTYAYLNMPPDLKCWAIQISQMNRLDGMTKEEILKQMTPALTPDFLLVGVKVSIVNHDPHPQRDESRRVSGHMPGIDQETIDQDAWDVFKKGL